MRITEWEYDEQASTLLSVTRFLLIRFNSYNESYPGRVSYLSGHQQRVFHIIMQLQHIRPEHELCHLTDRL